MLGSMRNAGLAALALAAGLATGTAGAMTYGLVEQAGCGSACPKLIVAFGEIGLNENVAFLAFLKRAREQGPVANTVLITSGGGFLAGGLKLGRAFREEKMAVTVGQPAAQAVTRTAGLAPSLCASACVLVLAGGVQRHVVPGSRIGVHRANNGPPVRDAAGGGPINGELNHDELYEVRARHYRAMGVDPAIARLTNSTPTETIYWLTPAEIARFRLAAVK